MAIREHMSCPNRLSLGLRCTSSASCSWRFSCKYGSRPSPTSPAFIKSRCSQPPPPRSLCA